MASLANTPLHQQAVITRVDGNRRFRRRLLELGLVPGTAISLVNIAPLGDPLEIEIRGCRFSIRRHEAAQVQVSSK